MRDSMPASPSRSAVVAAFAAVYVIWGSTYLAIRYAVDTLPPFTMAGTRFLVAGGCLYAWMRLRGVPRPQWIHWRSAAIIGGLLLLGGNGLVCWAEQSVPSGMAALLVAAVPLWMVLLNAIRPGGVWPNRAEILGVAIGFVGVGVLINPWSSSTSGVSVDRLGAFVLVLASLFWATGSLYSRHAERPASPLMSTATVMLAGSVILLVVGLGAGEWSRIEPAEISLISCLALLYLIVFGAIVGFSAYMWLLRVSTPARVSTYAYVNPAVAVLLGWAIASEPLSARTYVAMALIVSSVILITTFGRSATAQTRQSDVGPPDPGRSTPAVAVTKTAPLFEEPPAEGNVHRLADLIARRSQSDGPYLEFLRRDSLSVGLYVLPAGGVDPQEPHTEDEVYYVISGRARIRVHGADSPVEPGSVVFVRAGIEHRFHTIEEELTVLVFFAPAEQAQAAARDEVVSAACDA